MSIAICRRWFISHSMLFFRITFILNILIYFPKYWKISYRFDLLLLLLLNFWMSSLNFACNQFMLFTDCCYCCSKVKDVIFKLDTIFLDYYQQTRRVYSSISIRYINIGKHLYESVVFNVCIECKGTIRRIFDIYIQYLFRHVYKIQWENMKYASYTMSRKLI